MRQHIRTVFLIPFLFFLLVGCSEESANNSNTTSDDANTTAIENDIIGSWTPSGGSVTGETWQFFPDGTFIDTENVAYRYQIQKIEGANYLAFNREGLNIELSEEDQEELENAFGQSEFVPIYEALMPSQDSLVLEPATRIYGSDSYFGFTIETLVLQKQ